MKPLWIALVSALVGGVCGWTLANRQGEKDSPSADRSAEALRPAAPAAPDPVGLARQPTEVSDVAALRARIAELERRLASGSAADSARKEPAPTVLSPSLEAKSTDELIDLAQALRKRVEATLLAPSPTVASRYANLLSRPQTGQARILPRGKYDTVIESRGGGAYYSFATRSNSYDREPDVELQQGKFGSSFYGGTWGYVLDLGPIAIERVTESPSALPPGLEEGQRPTWELLWESAETTKDGYSREFLAKANELGLQRSYIPAVRGHTYVVRAILPGEHDHLVAFSPVEEDEHGQTLVWRVLKSWPVESRR